MTSNHPDPFEYEVAISFATQDRSVAEELTKLLSKKNISVFLDEYTSAEPWGNDLVNHLVNLYARKARYCVMLVSKDYPLKQWTERERRSLQERALRDANEYILAVRLDDREVPGLNESPGYQDLRLLSVADIVDRLEQKLATAIDESGPPARSHDLRSGNVPPAEHQPDK
jgi:hypothetical protein